jgi:hypothetical protein
VTWIQWLWLQFTYFGQWYTEWVFWGLAWLWFAFGWVSKAVCGWLVACWWRRGCQVETKVEECDNDDSRVPDELPDQSMAVAQ